MRARPLALWSLGLALATPFAASAGEVFAGAYAHDIDDPLTIGGNEGGAQIFIGAKTTALDELAILRRPRVRLLAAVNTDGGINYVATGLSWRLPLGQRFYLEPGVGVALHDGSVDLPSPSEPGITVAEALRRQRDRDTKLDLGSRVTFQPEIQLGWKATERLSLELSWAHLSHAQLAGRQNPGVSDVGLRVVYRYGLDRGF